MLSVSYQQILLNLLVQKVQLSFPVVQTGAGLMVPLFPLVEILLIQILIGQHQSPQTLPGKLLQSSKGNIKHSWKEHTAGGKQVKSMRREENQFISVQHKPDEKELR